ncbi:exopolysaccharide biosynthesis protein [Brevundimonas subvibrioides]|uniref:Exopolysaccharide synthesis ExoD n=1 Tax=Brevundimonas subvibrioides (strain ATCC 15264 / DSM 4735 / LMG 14903 / NBRC 16000 / CB 81) TaxID=633149 RepID=D9QKP7_BRESC|nr:exopolysaccharide biosynthesis protein [Brevundimonas subvibrioides]ADL01711.1 Exopolysaccharide synthesis ExoD [Brevundimonas subvibrioides ATCC 15264]
MPDYDFQSDQRPFSTVLDDIGAKDDPKLYLGELINAFGERGFGALMVFFGLINAIASPIPGSTTILGAPLLLICLHLVIRRDQLWMPAWALSRSIPRDSYRTTIGKVRKPLTQVERLSRPRFSVMSNEVSEVLIGVVTSLLTVIIMLPIFGGNLFPSLFVALFGFGLMQRDGALIGAAWLGVAGFGVFVWAAWSLIVAAFQTSLHWFHQLV